MNWGQKYVQNIFSHSLKNKLSPEKSETNQVFSFQLLNDKIDQNTNFAKLPSAKWLFWYNCKRLPCYDSQDAYQNLAYIEFSTHKNCTAEKHLPF